MIVWPLHHANPLIGRAVVVAKVFLKMRSMSFGMHSKMGPLLISERILTNSWLGPSISHQFVVFRLASLVCYCFYREELSHSDADIRSRTSRSKESATVWPLGPFPKLSPMNMPATSAVRSVACGSLKVRTDQGSALAGRS